VTGRLLPALSRLRDGPWRRRDRFRDGGWGGADSEEDDAIEHMRLEPLEGEVDHRGDVQGDQLGDDQATDDHQSQRPAGGAVRPEANCDGERRRRRRAPS